MCYLTESVKYKSRQITAVLRAGFFARDGVCELCGKKSAVKKIIRGNLALHGA
jgi:hypothetical protein